MPATVVVGLQWGDEGKAKVLDELSARADIVCRFQGGANAGHTVVVDGEKYKFHLVPCGVARPGKPCYIGNGVALDLVALVEEIRHFEERGLEVRNRLTISDRAHLVMPYHKLVREAVAKFQEITGEVIGNNSGGEDSAEAEPQESSPASGAEVEKAATTSAFEEELYDARFYIEEAMYKEALLSIKRVLKEEPKHTEALALVVDIKKRLKK